MRDRFRLLAGARGAAARQATLRAAIDWSWDLLAPWEQAALAQCSVFEGGFTLAAAEAVLDLSAWPDAPPAMDVVQALVDKSLLRALGAGATQTRYAIDEPYFGMYISIHEYAAEKLRASGAARGAGRAAAARPATSPASAATRRSRRCRPTAACSASRALRLELDNLVAACRRALAAGRRRRPRSPPTAPPGRCSRCRGRSPSVPRSAPRSARSTPDLRFAARGGTPDACRGADACRRLEGSRAWLAQALDRVRALGDRRQEGRVLGKLGSLYLWQGRVDEARAHYAAALQIHREVGTRLMEGRTIGNLGISHHEQGQIGAGARRTTRPPWPSGRRSAAGATRE